MLVCTDADAAWWLWWCTYVEDAAAADDDGKLRSGFIGELAAGPPAFTGVGLLTTAVM